MNPLPTPHSEVALVMNAGTDAGFRIARALLQAGYRVAATGRHVTHLARIIQGHSPNRVLAIAADDADGTQVTKLIDRVETRFDRRIDLIVRVQNDSHRSATPTRKARCAPS